jgi:hypothetical protein
VSHEPAETNPNPAVPVVRRRRPEAAVRTARYVRAGLAATAIALAGVFAVAAWLDPYDAAGNPRRMATHTQLGMPECNFVKLTGKPCPACGMTTSFALLVRGDVAASLRANWAGTMIAAIWAATLAWAVAGGIAGRPLFVPQGRGELILTVAVGAVLVLMLVRWGVVLLG